MKLVLITFLILGFVSAVVFGALAVSHNSHGHNDCLAAIAQAGDCPTQTNLLEYLAFHLTTVKSFSTVTFGKSLSNSLLVLVLFALGISSRKLANTLVQLRFSLAYSYRGQKEFLRSLPKRELIHWLSLKETSPTFF